MVSHSGCYLPATRVAGDSVVNLSPNLINEFFIPYVQKMADGIGTELHLHYCSISTAPATHILDALVDCRAIAGLSSHRYTYGGRTDPVDLQRYVKKRYALFFGDYEQPKTTPGFRSWASDLAERWRDPRGIILGIGADTPERGREFRHIWDEVWLAK